MEIIASWTELSGFIIGILSLIATCAVFIIGICVNKKIDEKKEIKEKELTDLINSIEKNTSTMNEILGSIENIISNQLQEKVKNRFLNNDIVKSNDESENIKAINLFKNNDLKSVEEGTKKIKIVALKQNKLNQKEKKDNFLKNKKKIN